MSDENVLTTLERLAARVDDVESLLAVLIDPAEGEPVGRLEAAHQRFVERIRARGRRPA